MNLNARSIAVKGLGYGALAVALAGFISVASSGLVVLPPTTRTYRVRAENRRRTVALEYRRYILPAEVRMTAVAAEIRRRLVIAENRRILIAFEDRKVKVH